MSNSVSRAAAPTNGEVPLTWSPTFLEVPELAELGTPDRGRPGLGWGADDADQQLDCEDGGRAPACLLRVTTLLVTVGTTVTIPLSLPGIFAGCMLTAVPTTGEFVIPAILGGGKVVVWGWLIYEEFTAGRNWPMGSALSNVLLLVMLGIVVLYVKAVGTEDF